VRCALAGRRRRATLAYDVIHKTGSTKRITTPPEEDRATAVGNTHKICQDRTYSFEDNVADRQKHTHTDTHTHTDELTDRHAHHNTPLPYRGRSKNGYARKYR